ncbi:MAG: hypothetical protein PSV18_02555 [Methylobacter sp.]|uniref:Uncharacterized protein n=1 Tax=Candidatus Methylobacter titanis TaxID=3053457 RepID=A0AA43TJ63_9GAMM|nr:hypothetical protein [Candidatus Methylobacter titanis]MDI1291611.1 hypothetical protein [Candidatus Methylobacter titanis]
MVGTAGRQIKTQDQGGASRRQSHPYLIGFIADEFAKEIPIPV